jgi:hypothetical protein
MGTLTFKVELSGSPKGPWEIVGENLTNTLVFEDTNYKTFGAMKDRYYRVSTQDGAFVSDPHPVLGGMRKQQFLISRKIFNDELVLLKKGIGIRMAVIKRRHWGERCECVDPLTNLSVNSDCPLCFGTKVLQGYYEPIMTWGHIQPASIGTDYDAQAAAPEVENTNAFLLSFPLVYKDDILVELETNRRWLIVSTKQTELLRNAVHQDILISRLSVEDPAYKLEVNSCLLANTN